MLATLWRRWRRQGGRHDRYRALLLLLATLLGCSTWASASVSVSYYSRRDQGLQLVITVVAVVVVVVTVTAAAAGRRWRRGSPRDVRRLE